MGWKFGSIDHYVPLWRPLGLNQVKITKYVILLDKSLDQARWSQWLGWPERCAFRKCILHMVSENICFTWFQKMYVSHGSHHSSTHAPNRWARHPFLKKYDLRQHRQNHKSSLACTQFWRKFRQCIALSIKSILINHSCVNQLSTWSVVEKDRLWSGIGLKHY